MDLWFITWPAAYKRTSSLIWRYSLAPQIKQKKKVENYFHDELFDSHSFRNFLKIISDVTNYLAKVFSIFITRKKKEEKNFVL